MRKQRRIPSATRIVIEELADKRYEPAEIERALAQRGDLDRPLPTLPTIRDIVKERRPADPSGTWAISDTEDESDAATVLALLRDVIDGSDGRIRAFTRHETTWLLRVARAAPGLASWGVWRTAREYIRREALNLDTNALTHFLAYRPWSSDAHAHAYLDAVYAGRIEQIDFGELRAIEEAGDATDK